MRHRSFFVILTLVVLVVTAVQLRRAYSVAQAQSVKPAATAFPIDRTVLPIREPAYPESTILDARQATAPAHATQTDGQ
jgi:arylsulfatase